MNVTTAVRELFEDPVYMRRILRRAVLFWAVLRCTLLAFSLALELEPTLSVPGVVLVAACVTLMCHVDARFMRETLFYGNLGVPTWSAAASGVAVTFIAEIGIGLGAALVQVLR